jgi:hypothetical protein
VGARGQGAVRSVVLQGLDPLSDRLTRLAAGTSRGDGVEVHVLRLDEDGRPVGNRRERRMGARQQRRLKCQHQTK